MSTKKFIYFITDEQGKSLQVVNGIVVLLNTPKQLSQAPDGNQEIAIGWERSQTDHGTVRNFSLPLGFLMEAATMLRDNFYKYNLDLKRFLLIKRLTYEYTPTTFKEYYKQLYKGQFDWATADDSQGEFRFNIGILEGGLQKLLKAKEGTDYEIPFDGDAKNVLMDGLFIQGKFRWLLTADSFQNEKFPSMYLLPNDEPVPGLAIFEIQKSNGAVIDEDSIEYFALATQDIAGVHITGLLADVNFSFADLNIEIVIYNSISDAIRLTIDLAPADPYASPTNIVIDETVDLLEGDRLFLRVGEPPLSFITWEESNFQIEAKSKPADSVIPGFTLFDLGLKLLSKIGIAESAFESAMLEAKNIIVTSGDGVRGLPKASIKTNWRDYKKAVDVFCKSQVTVTTNKVIIEARETAYDSAQTPIELDEIKNFKCTPATDQLATSVKVGHQDPQVDDTNGKFSFNSSIIFATPINAIPDRQFDLQSPWKADPYEIERKRANFEGKTTTDTEIDNDIYALAVLPEEDSNTFDSLASFNADGAPIAPGYPLMNLSNGFPIIRPGMKIRITGSALNDKDLTINTVAAWFFGQLITTNEALVDEANVNITVEIIEGQYYSLDRTPAVTQLIEPPDVDQETKDGLYNVPLSPKRLLLVHATWLAGMLNKYTPGSLVFSSEVRNKELIASGIIEKANVPIVNLGDPMFLPYYFEFDTISPVDMTALLEANPNPVFSFIWQNNTYTGFFIRGGIALNDLEEQTFKLLACPENNVLNLI